MRIIEIIRNKLGISGTEVIKNLIFLGIIFLFIFLLVSSSKNTSDKPSQTFTSFTPTPSSTPPSLEDQKIVRVDISGAVQKPGVYGLKTNAIVNDIIEQAGGLREDADHDQISSSINKSQRIYEGMKITIPSKNSKNVPQVQLININTAIKQDIIKLPGVSASSADKIIFMRPYKSTYELVEKGIIKKTVFEKIKQKLVI